MGSQLSDVVDFFENVFSLVPLFDLPGEGADLERSIVECLFRRLLFLLLGFEEGTMSEAGEVFEVGKHLSAYLFDVEAGEAVEDVDAVS